MEVVIAIKWVFMFSWNSIVEMLRLEVVTLEVESSMKWLGHIYCHLISKMKTELQKFEFMIKWEGDMGVIALWREKEEIIQIFVY